MVGLYGKNLKTDSTRAPHEVECGQRGVPDSSVNSLHIDDITQL